MTTDNMFHRLEILVGPKVLKDLKNTNVIIFGVGGVGSWCAEGLVRNSIGNITIVDSDLICSTNINRQLQATHNNIGQSKVEELKKRLLTINPNVKLNAIKEVYNQQTFDKFDLANKDYVIDAIDSLNNKVDLIARTLDAGLNKNKPILFSAMGAACKIDPSKIKTGSFWKIKGCPLAKFVRKRLRNRKMTDNFKCVYSDEILPAFPSAMVVDDDLNKLSNKHSNDLTSQKTKRQINGSAVHVTATFGFYLSGMVLQNVVERISDNPLLYQKSAINHG